MNKNKTIPVQDFSDTKISEFNDPMSSQENVLKEKNKQSIHIKERYSFYKNRNFPSVIQI